MSKNPADSALLKTLTPLNGLKPENLQTLAQKAVVEECASGRFVFKQGDADKRTIYILEGEVELRAGDEVVRTLKGGSPESKNPVAPQTPRTVSARAKTNVKYLAVDSDLLDVMLTWDQTGSFEVGELTVEEESGASSDDWMTSVLASKAFHRIPPSNIQAMFMRMEPVQKKSGEPVITQGEEGDYFYVITEGKASVTRETPMNKEGIKLAELGVGDTFGEEALISEAKRNATVTMITDGTLMRLSKQDFAKLLQEPMSNHLNYEEAKKIVEDGGVWLDVRLPTEFKNEHEEGAINIPLVFIRLKLNQIPQDKKVVVYCDTGRRSSAAAYILQEKGFEAYVLKDGLSGGKGA